MSGTIRTQAYLLATSFPDNTTGQILPQNMRDFVVSVPLNAAPITTTTYTASGALALTDDESIVNASSAVTMTLANGSGPKVMYIKRYGAGAVTVTGTIDGTTSQSVLLNSVGGKELMRLSWNSGLTTWIMG
jgi:hypothetical protein